MKHSMIHSKLNTFKKSIDDIRRPPYPYPHWMFHEINQQSTIINDIVNTRLNNEVLTFNELDNIPFETIDNLIIIGCGTSYYAGKTGDIFPKHQNVLIRFVFTMHQNLKCQIYQKRSNIVSIVISIW